MDYPPAKPIKIEHSLYYARYKESPTKPSENVAVIESKAISGDLEFCVYHHIPVNCMLEYHHQEMVREAERLNTEKLQHIIGKNTP